MTAIAYENQLLGAFIYALGFEAGRNQQSVPVNLFQQTPLDSCLGDLIVGGAHCVAIEFKRRRADLRSERNKWRPDLVKWLNGKPELLETSRRGHFVCFGDHGDSEVKLSFARYFQAYNDMDKIVSIPASVAVKQLTAPLLPGKRPAWGVAGTALLSYLDAIRAFRRTEGGRSGVYSATWLTVCVTGSGYQILAAPSLEALLGFSQEHEHAHARSHERTSEHEQEYDGPSL
ncbi:hypothetical protein [uncultured Xanthomonas sp.]|uniref:hypothetical protein n=1 Tax=uncultured Xanthomonas sp. TaxID=152831 RepID=UPI0025DD382D|nr:hypothetical protein [uncultured Xanthomonas sp.]